MSFLVSQGVIDGFLRDDSTVFNLTAMNLTTNKDTTAHRYVIPQQFITENFHVRSTLQTLQNRGCRAEQSISVRICAFDTGGLYPRGMVLVEEVDVPVLSAFDGRGTLAGVKSGERELSV